VEKGEGRREEVGRILLNGRPSRIYFQLQRSRIFIYIFSGIQEQNPKNVKIKLISPISIVVH
jgi:hypothetical protein